MEQILQFFKGRRGDVISRLPSGKIALVNKKSDKKPAIGEKWICRVDFEKERFTVVTPIARIVTKQRPVYKRYKCGHRVLLRTEEVEVLENEEIEPRVVNYDFEICDECKKSCNHRELELDRNSFELWVRCKWCRKLMSSYELDMDKISDILKDVRQRFPEVAEAAEKELNTWMSWKREYKENLERRDEISAKISEILSEIREWVKENIDDYVEDEYYTVRVSEEKEELYYFAGFIEIPIRTYIVRGQEKYEWAKEALFKKAENIPESIREKIREIRKLREELSNIEWWLTENRPVE